MIAKFIGQTSMGFQYGEVYEIVTWTQGNLIWVRDMNSKIARCPYQSVEAFINNWMIIRGSQVSERTEKEQERLTKYSKMEQKLREVFANVEEKDIESESWDDF